MKLWEFLTYTITVVMLNNILFVRSYTDITDKVFGSVVKKSRGCILAAFGDFDANKRTDIFAICEGGKQVIVLLASQHEAECKQKTLVQLLDSDGYITSVVPSDFDGDAQMDLLVTAKTKTSDLLNLTVYWGNLQAGTVEEPFFLTDQLQDEPLVVDWNGDQLPDLLAETSTGRRHVFISHARSFQRVSFPDVPGGSGAVMRRPQSNAFVDMDSDYAADLVITTQSGYEVWHKQVSGWTMQNNITMTSVSATDHLGQTAFTDVDQDGWIDMLLPTTSSAGSNIHVYSKKQWSVLGPFHDGNQFWQFASTRFPLTADLHLDLPVTLRIADYDLDGYPDILTMLVPMSQTNTRLPQAFLLMNEACKDSRQDCLPTGRRFNVKWDEPIGSQAKPVTIATFYDIFEDGTVDILTGSAPPNGTLTALKNDDVAGLNFVKILVVSGRCPNGCPEDREPYGVNNMGPTIKYTTTKTSGDTQQSCFSQLSQSAHFALQMPYTIVGLAQTPNFIDKLGVGLPLANNQTTPSVHEWKQIIPNSQLITVPSPRNRPSRWTLKLYLTPSHAVLMTGAVLAATCVFIAAIIAVLHVKEKREDKKEKRQDAHKFHFDAM